MKRRALKSKSPILVLLFFIFNVVINIFSVFCMKKMTHILENRLFTMISSENFKDINNYILVKINITELPKLLIFQP